MQTSTTRWRKRLIGLAAVAALGSTLTVIHRSDGGTRLTPVDETPWSAHIEVMDQALANRNVPAALAAWREAHAAALGSHGWEGMLEVGDAYLRIGEVADFRRAFVPGAREHYLGALLRARQVGSADGVLRTAEACAALGDLGIVRQAVVIAERLVGPHPNVRVIERLGALSRWTGDHIVAAVQR